MLTNQIKLMAYEIEFNSQSIADLDILRSFERTKVIEAIETNLRYEPTKESKSRIKRLRRLISPQYRLRVDDIRVFYDIVENTVEILAIISKPQSAEWLAREGKITNESTED